MVRMSLFIDILVTLSLLPTFEFIAKPQTTHFFRIKFTNAIIAMLSLL